MWKSVAANGLTLLILVPGLSLWLVGAM